MSDKLGNMWGNTTISSDWMIGILVVLVLLTLALTVGVHYYQRFRKFQQFRDEIVSLELDEEQENTFVELIKRYALNEPVDVLMSIRLFDELAAQEIERILGSSGSTQSKQRFVNMIYEIRRKTFFPDTSPETEQETQDTSSSSHTQTVAV